MTQASTPQAEFATLRDIFEGLERFGDAPFLSYVDDLDAPPVESLTFAEFLARANCVAGNLYAVGVRKGDRVALFAMPRTDYVVSIAGAVLLGAVASPVNHHFKKRELASMLTVLEPAVVVADAATVELVEAAVEVSGVPAAVAGISGLAAAVDLFAADAPAWPRPALDASDPAIILHSSGTSGMPKAALRSHGSLADFLDVFAEYFEDDEHLLNFLPLYHQAGLVLTVLAAARIGADVVQASRYSTSAFWTLVDRYEATHTNLVAPIPSFLLQQEPRADDRDHSLRWIVIAGRNDHWADFQDRFGVTGMTFYGSTETLQITSTGSPQGGPVAREILEQVGAGIYTGPTFGNDTAFRIMDPTGTEELPVGTHGRIQARGRYCFAEYFNQPEQTAKAFTRDGWFITGDIGYATPEGALVLIGRETGMIRRSGENIAPREIEVLLEDHPAVKEALVVGVPDDARGEEILARVVRVDGASLDAAEVYAYLDENLSDFKVPRYLVFHDEFQHTATFKIKLDQGAGDDRSTWFDRVAR